MKHCGAERSFIIELAFFVTQEWYTYTEHYLTKAKIMYTFIVTNDINFVARLKQQDVHEIFGFRQNKDQRVN